MASERSISQGGLRRGGGLRVNFYEFGQNGTYLVSMLYEVAPKSILRRHRVIVAVMVLCSTELRRRRSN